MRAIPAAVLVVVLAGCKCDEKRVAVPPPTIPSPIAQAAPIARPPASNREPVGAGLNADPKATAGFGSMVIGDDGQPVIAWMETNAIHVRRWTGSDWEVLGGGPVGTRVAGHPQVSIGRDSKVWVAFKEHNEKDLARGRVVKLEAGAWKDAGALLGNNEHVDHFAFSARTSPPTFAWTEVAGDKHRLHVSKLDGEAWKPIGAGTLWANEAANVLRPPALVALANGAPVIGWLEKEPGKTASHLQRWDTGTAKWVALPELTGASVDGDSFLELTATADGTLYLGMSWNPGLQALRMLAPGAAEWTQLALPVAAAATPMQLAAAGKTLAFSFAHDGMQLARWDGAAWQVLDAKVFDGMGNPVGVALGPKGEVYISWQDAGPEGGEASQLRVARYK